MPCFLLLCAESVCKKTAKTVFLSLVPWLCLCLQSLHFFVPCSKVMYSSCVYSAEAGGREGDASTGFRLAPPSLPWGV
jgi:hypothetical protein